MDKEIEDRLKPYHENAATLGIEPEPTTALRFVKRKVNKLNLDGSHKYFRILQQCFISRQTGTYEWQDIPVVDERDL